MYDFLSELDKAVLWVGKNQSCSRLENNSQSPRLTSLCEHEQYLNHNHLSQSWALYYSERMTVPLPVTTRGAVPQTRLFHSHVASSLPTRKRPAVRR